MSAKKMNTTANKIRSVLRDITNRFALLIKDIPIKYLHGFSDGFVVIAPEHYWGERTPEQTNTQIELKKKYDTISEILSLIFSKAPKDVSIKLEQADKRFRT